MFCHYMSTDIYILQTVRIKIVRRFLRSNPFGHTIFFTREKYHMPNQKPDTINLRVTKIVSDFTSIS